MIKPRIHNNSCRAFINNSGISVFIAIISHAFTLIPVQTSVLIKVFALVQAFTPTFVFVLDPPKRYIDKNLQKATNLTLKLFVKG